MSPPHAWCFCNSSREHIAEFDTDMRVLRFRPASALERQQFKAFVLYRSGVAPAGEPSAEQNDAIRPAYPGNAGGEALPKP